MRRITGWLLILPALCAPATAGEVPPRVPELSKAGAAALDAGLARLIAEQQPGGFWTADVGYKMNSGYVVTERRAPHVGVTALAALALLWSGRDPAGEELREALGFVLGCESGDGDGYISRNGTRMYSHAFATIFLGEMARVTGHGKARAAAARATKFIWTCQNHYGGWHYAPFDRHSDLTVTACQILALRVSMAAGIEVPGTALDKARFYVLRSANTGRREAGSFRYAHRPGQALATRSSYPIAAAGAASLLGTGLRTDEDLVRFLRKDGVVARKERAPTPRIAPMLRYLRNTYATTPRRHYFFWFGNLFAVQACRLAGDREWKGYFQRVQRDLVEDQRTSGAWPDRHVGDSFATACGCLILLVPRIPVVPALAR